MATAPKRKGLLRLLKPGSTLETPPFQRSYAWRKEQVEEFWSDMRRALDATGGPEEYFLGLVVLDDGKHIQDGQQRLATTLLLASEMYRAAEISKKVGSPDSTLSTDLTSVISSPLRTSPATLAIEPKDQELLLSDVGIRSGSQESARRLAAARKQLRKLLAADLANRGQPDPQLKRLKSWADFLESKAYVVVLKVPPHNAHSIFETLNTRGLRLSNGDLVKSHLIAGAPATDTSKAVAKWGEVTTFLTDASGGFEDDLERFLLHFFGSRFGLTTNRKLFADFRQAVSERTSLSVLNELIKNARIYAALADPFGKPAFWRNIGDDAQRSVGLLNALGMRQLRYLLISVLRDLGTNQKASARNQKRREAIVKITNWSVRGLVHSRTGGGEAGDTYIAAAEDIRSGKIKTVDKLREHFENNELLPADDDLFETAFRDHNFDKKTSHTAARLILESLELSKIASRSGLSIRDTLTVEHVLPQSRDAGSWTHFTDEEHLAYAYRLGNLVLVDGPSGANNALGNKEWADKKALVQQWGDQTPLTTEALKEVDWTKQAIDGRDDALAKLAVKTFAI